MTTNGALLTHLAALSIAVCGVAAASTPPPTGPEVRQFVAHPRKPDVVFAATRLGIFKSEDGGSSWVQSNGGRKELEDSVVWELQFPAADPDRVYAVAEPAGIFRSADEGRTWRRFAIPGPADPMALNGPPSYWRVRAVAAHPTAPSILIAGGDTGLFRTTDGGRNWVHVSRVRDIMVRGLAFDPSNADRVYAGTHRQILVSNDSGLSWLPLEAPSFATFRDRWFGDFLVSRGRPSTIYVNAAGMTIFTPDAGRTWQRLNGACGQIAVSDAGLLISSCVMPFTIGGMRTSIDAGSISRSDDGGASWKPINTGLPKTWFAPALYIHPARAGVYFASWANGRVFRTVDGGATWTDSSKGLTWCDLAASDPVKFGKFGRPASCSAQPVESSVTIFHNR